MSVGNESPILVNYHHPAPLDLTCCLGNVWFKCITMACPPTYNMDFVIAQHPELRFTEFAKPAVAEAKVDSEIMLARQK